MVDEFQPPPVNPDNYLPTPRNFATPQQLEAMRTYAGLLSRAQPVRHPNWATGLRDAIGDVMGGLTLRHANEMDIASKNFLMQHRPTIPYTGAPGDTAQPPTAAPPSGGPAATTGYGGGPFQAGLSGYSSAPPASTPKTDDTPKLDVGEEEKPNVATIPDVPPPGGAPTQKVASSEPPGVAAARAFQKQFNGYPTMRALLNKYDISKTVFGYDRDAVLNNLQGYTGISPDQPITAAMLNNPQHSQYVKKVLDAVSGGKISPQDYLTALKPVVPPRPAPQAPTQATTAAPTVGKEENAEAGGQDIASGIAGAADAGAGAPKLASLGNGFSTAPADKAGWLTAPPDQLGMGPGGKQEVNAADYLNSSGGFSTINGQRGPIGAFHAMNPDLQARLVASGQAYQQETGKQPDYGQADRDPATQAKYWEESRHGTLWAAAPPGMSEHQRGNAMDVHGGYADWLHAGNAERFGLNFPVRGDYPHVQAIPNWKGDQVAQNTASRGGGVGGPAPGRGVGGAPPSSQVPPGIIPYRPQIPWWQGAFNAINPYASDERQYRDEQQYQQQHYPTQGVNRWGQTVIQASPRFGGQQQVITPMETMTQQPMEGQRFESKGYIHPETGQFTIPGISSPPDAVPGPGGRAEPPAGTPPVNVGQETQPTPKTKLANLETGDTMSDAGKPGLTAGPMGTPPPGTAGPTKPPGPQMAGDVKTGLGSYFDNLAQHGMENKAKLRGMEEEAKQKAETAYAAQKETASAIGKGRAEWFDRNTRLVVESTPEIRQQMGIIRDALDHGAQTGLGGDILKTIYQGITRFTGGKESVPLELFDKAGNHLSLDSLRALTKGTGQVRMFEGLMNKLANVNINTSPEANRAILDIMEAKLARQMEIAKFIYGKTKENHDQPPADIESQVADKYGDKPIMDESVIEHHMNALDAAEGNAGGEKGSAGALGTLTPAQEQRRQELINKSKQ